MGEPLRSEARDALDVPVDEERVQRVWRAVGARRRTRHRSAQRAMPWLAAGAAGAAVVAVILLATGERTDGTAALRTASGEPFASTVAPEGAPRRVDLADRSSIDLAPGSQLDVLENEARALTLNLRRGRATFDVTPGGPRRWTVETPAATVEVVGTRFVVELEGREVRIEVDHGVVIVRGERVPERVARLTAGERLVIEISPVAEAAEATRAAEPVAPPAPATEPVAEATEPAHAVEPAAEPAPTTEPAPATEPRSAEDAPATGTAAAEGVDGNAPAAAAEAPEPDLGTAGQAPEGTETSNETPEAPDWRRLAHAGDYAASWDLVQPLADRMRGASVGDLMLLADVARLSGHPAEATAPLERIISAHPHDSQAGLAAFTLGRVQMDELGRPRAAAHSFSRAVELGLPPALLEHSMARLAEAFGRADDPAGARRAAEQYLELFPDGRHAARMRRLLGR